MFIRRGFTLLKIIPTYVIPVIFIIINLTEMIYIKNNRIWPVIFKFSLTILD